MRILYVMFNAPPLHSGRARQALMLADALNQRPGVCVQAISLDQGVPIPPPHEPPLRLRMDVWQAWPVWRAILWFCVRQRIDVVHFHGHGYACHLTPILRRLGIRVFLHMTLRGFDDPATLLDGRGSRLQRYALSRLSAWVVQNPDDQISGHHPPVINIPNAVAAPLPRRDTGPIRTIVMSAVVCPRKGQLELLRCFAAIPPSVRKRLRLRLAGSYGGDYWEYDADYVQACQRIADTIPEASLLGHLSKDALMNELREAHYFAAISTVEGLSNAYLECLNHGLLPIVYEGRHDPLFDTLDMEPYLIRIPGDGTDLNPTPEPGALALARALDSAPWSDALATRIQARVAARFGLAEITERLYALYAG